MEARFLCNLAANPFPRANPVLIRVSIMWSFWLVLLGLARVPGLVDETGSHPNSSGWTGFHSFVS